MPFTCSCRCARLIRRNSVSENAALCGQAASSTFRRFPASVGSSSQKTCRSSCRRSFLWGSSAAMPTGVTVGRVHKSGSHSALPDSFPLSLRASSHPVS